MESQRQMILKDLEQKQVKASGQTSDNEEKHKEVNKILDQLRAGERMSPVVNTMKPVLRDHCDERPPVLTDHIFTAEGPTFQYN